MSKESNLSRRDFMGAVAVAGAVMAACGSTQTQQQRTSFLDTAPDGPPLKAGLIGCGGRGTGAAIQFLGAGPNLQLTALADVFQVRLDEARLGIAVQRGQQVPDDHCFIGFDAYQKLIDSGVDVVLIATPPHFRAQHFEAAIAAKKHVFMEKPVSVDPVGCRSIIDTGKKAKTSGLTVVTGTQRRHQRSYLEAYQRVTDGAIGEILNARVHWNQAQLWYKERKEEWSDMEWMIRDWVNWTWLSGDHITEQHVHNLDVANWFTNSHPVRALGFGSRERRVTGDQYDFFTVDYEMASGIHVLSTCRQINGCTNDVSEYLVGTNGTAKLSSGNCTLYKKDGSVLWDYNQTVEESGYSGPKKTDPYDQEHVDLVTAIRTNTPINEAENTATSTMMAVMGRISAYTGLATTWDEMMNSDLRLGPTEYAMGPVPSELEAKVPVPGSDKRPS